MHRSAGHRAGRTGGCQPEGPACPKCRTRRPGAEDGLVDVAPLEHLQGRAGRCSFTAQEPLVTEPTRCHPINPDPHPLVAVSIDGGLVVVNPHDSIPVRVHQQLGNADVDQVDQVPVSNHRDRITVIPAERGYLVLALAASQPIDAHIPRKRSVEVR